MMKTLKQAITNKWLLETSEGLAELKRKGMTDEQIEKLKSDIKDDPLYKKVESNHRNF
ncbi:MAG: hypothetical protein Q8O13_01075 [Candidatus Omnitrophota bacterium]|nr:hypothetical protein [Candidatus Omnitrophota bacterium]